MRIRHIAFVLAIGLLASACSTTLRTDLIPICPSFSDSGELIEITRGAALMAQSTPEASLHPCLDQVRPGWSVTNFDVERGRTRLTLHSSRLGDSFLRLEVRTICTPTGVKIASDEPGTDLYVDIVDTPRGPDVERSYRGSWWYVYPGGCTELKFDAEGEGATYVDGDVAVAISFFEANSLIYGSESGSDD